MKYTIPLIIFSFLFSSVTLAQEIIKKDGFYVDKKNNKYDGFYTTYHTNGVRKAIYTLKDGLENGAVEFYYSTTQIMEKGTYKEGKKNGVWTRWSDSGNKLAEAIYKNGDKDGKWVIWDEKGVKRYEMYYSNGTKIGVWIMWDENGKISGQKEFK